MKPTTTIGVCVKNCASCISGTIDSIQIQDYPHKFLEVVFVDDGSEDSTLSVIREYVPKLGMKTKVFSHEWRGLGPSRNVVVRNASGKYIVWVDGDMTLPVDHVRKQVEFMENHPDVGIAKARYGVLADENLIGFLENAAYVGVDLIHGGKFTRRTVGTGGSIYRVEAIRGIGGFDDDLKGVGEDMDAELRMQEKGWLLYLGSPAIFYERRRKSVRAIWREGVWHGYGGYDNFRKGRKVFSFYKMTPVIGFLAGVWYSVVAYREIKRKRVFLLPVQYSFKRVAWCFGFAKGQLRCVGN